MDALENSFDISNVDPGTILQVETQNSIYRIEFIKDRIVEVTGGMKSNGEDRFSTPKEALLVGSIPPDICESYDNLGRIIAGEKLFLQCMKGEHLYLLRTSPVKNIKVESPDGKWNYDMEWKI